MTDRSRFVNQRTRVRIKMANRTCIVLVIDWIHRLYRDIIASQGWTIYGLTLSYHKRAFVRGVGRFPTKENRSCLFVPKLSYDHLELNSTLITADSSSAGLKQAACVSFAGHSGDIKAHLTLESTPCGLRISSRFHDTPEDMTVATLENPSYEDVNEQKWGMVGAANQS